MSKWILQILGGFQTGIDDHHKNGVMQFPSSIKIGVCLSQFHAVKVSTFCPDKVVGMSRIYKDIQQIHYQESIRTRKENHA